MGAKVELTGEKGTAPIKITGGKLKAIDYVLPVASAQVKSCVLLAGLFAEGHHLGHGADPDPRPHGAHVSHPQPAHSGGRVAPSRSPGLGGRVRPEGAPFRSRAISRPPPSGWWRAARKKGPRSSSAASG
jgi:hypothetical protein